MSPTKETNASEFQDAMNQLRNGDLGRRDFLRRIVVLGGSSSVAFGLLNQMEASGQIPSGGFTQVPSGSFPSGSHGHDHGQHTSPLPPATTGSFGEEGNPQYSTMRYGEENAVTPTTSAYGEEQGPPTTTTYAVGEEGGTQPVTSQAVGEEGNPNPITTYNIGEEGVAPPTSNTYGEEGSKVTTYAVGEEQTPPPNCYRPPASTMAYGEESTTPPATTQAWGEETQTLPQPPPTYTPPKVTTQRVGEEGTHLPIPPSTTQPSTQAVGEEGSVSPPRNSQPIRSTIESGIKNVVPNVWKSFRRW